jgi:hypothetical protein
VEFKFKTDNEYWKRRFNIINRESAMIKRFLLVIIALYLVAYMLTFFIAILKLEDAILGESQNMKIILGKLLLLVVFTFLAIFITQKLLKCGKRFKFIGLTKHLMLLRYGISLKTMNQSYCVITFSDNKLTANFFNKCVEKQYDDIKKCVMAHEYIVIDDIFIDEQSLIDGSYEQLQNIVVSKIERKRIFSNFNI